jgi:predicted transport protein
LNIPCEMMKIYTINNEKLNEVHEKQFKLEREIQNLFEANLNTIMGLTLVRSEFTIKNKRIDTLAFDELTNAFIIIEVKRDRNSSVVDQGFSYLKLMLENKADFIVEYNERLNKNLQRNDVDWGQSRVVFVSTGFTDNQIEATDFKDIAIELWEVKRYNNDTVAIIPIKKSRSAESIKPITQQTSEYKAIADEIKVYTEEGFLAKGSDETRELYNKFRDAILNLSDGIQVVPLKQYIAFKKDGNLVCMDIQKKQIRMWIGAKWGKLDDSKCLATDVSNTGHWGTGDYEVNVTSDKDLEYIMSLIKQLL